MSQVRGNPQEMRKFAAALRRFTQQLETEVKRIDAQTRSVGQTWNDNEYHKFMQDWEQMLSGIKRFVNEAPRYERHVTKKAADLEAYLRSGGF